MRQIRRGRGGWGNSFRLLTALTATGGVVLIVAAVGLGGCSSKQKGPGTGAATSGTTGMGEENLASNKSSLEQFQKGTLGGGTGGPLGDIHFDYDSSSVRSEDGDILRTNAKWLSQHPTTRVQVEGHCDQRGSEEYNIALGAKRAQAAKDYLVTLGVPDSRISTISYGKELPLCTEMTDSCWAQNRRDHFAVSQASQ